MKLLRKGKVKEVYLISDTELEFLFTDQISVFDKVIPSLIPRKGETLCKTAAYWFKVCENLGITSHFIELTGDNRMRVSKVDVIPNYTLLTPSSSNYLIPLELITRYYIAGSLNDRIMAGKIKPEHLGFRSGYKPEYGEKLPEPFFEQTTKLEKVDRPVSNSEAVRIAGLSRRDFTELKEAVLKIDRKINDEVKKRGLIHVDGKKEFAFDARRELMIVDTFGTADEDRFWDAKEYKQGRCVELSKEFVRQYYRNTGYYDSLIAAREKKRVPEGKPKPARRMRGAEVFKILRTKGLLKQFITLMKNILRRLRIRKLEADLTVGFDNPADTGLLFALIGPAILFLRTRIPHQIRVQPSFDAVCQGYFRGTVRLQPIQLVPPLLRFTLSLPTARAVKTLVLVKIKGSK